MPDFDPNEYLKKQSQSKGFDPNKYLEENTIEKKNLVGNDLPTGSQTSKRGFEPFLPQVPTKTPSVLLSDEQKQQREKQRIGERFQTTLLNVPTEFGKVAPTMRAAKQVRETLPQAPEFRRYGEIKPMQPVEITEGQRIGESLTKGEGFQEVVTDKLTGKKTALEKQIEAAENAFRAYQGDEIANQVQSYIPPEETLKIKQELGFGEKMSNAGSNFVNRLERFVPNTAIAVGQTLTTLLGEDLGSDAYRMITSGGNADFHRMEAFDKLAKLDSEYKYSKGLIQSIQDFDLGGVAAAVTDAVGSLVSTVVTSAPTAGLGLYSDMVGGGLYDYNSTKANRLGISVDELYETGQNEFFAPAIINGIAAKLEDIGLKGIKQGILSNIKSKAGQKAGLIFHNSNKEGFTEWTQSGLEAYSNSLAQGKNPIQAGEEAVRTMFSKKGAENYLMGTVAAGAAIGGGRILKGIVSSREKKKAADALQKIEQQQQELNNPAISEESRVFIFDNIKNNVKEVVDAVYADVDESDNLGENQKKEVFELNKTIQALEIVANDPAVSEETKASAQTRIDELKSKVDSIIAAPEIKLAKPTFDTEEQIIAEGQQAEAEFKQTDDLVTYEQKMKELDDRAKNLVPAPEDAEIGKSEAGISKDEVKESIRIQAKEEIANVLDDESLTEQQKEERVQQIVSAAKSQMKFYESDLKLPSLVVNFPTLSLSIPPSPFKIKLQELGYSDADISNMTIEQQQDIVINKKQAPEVASSAKVDSVKENARQERIAEMQAELDEDVETPKPKQDAVQVETAGQVPVLTEAPVGEEVEQGKPQAEAEITTEKGKQKEVAPAQQVEQQKLTESRKGGEVFPYKGEEYLIQKENEGEISAFSIVNKENVPLETIPNKDLKSFQNPLTVSKEVVEKADITKPIIIGDTGKDYFVLDGNHRLTKAMLEGKDIQAYVLTPEQTKKIKLENGKAKKYKTEIPQAEVTAEQQVEQLRAKEQAELKSAIPNVDQYLTDGKVDRAKITDAKDLKKFDEIYDKYDKLISPLLPKKETKAEPTPAKPKAEPRLKPRVETRIKFTKAIELFNDISATKGAAKKRTLSAKRRTFLEQNPSIKYIDDNWTSISKQLEDKGLLKKEGNCP